MQRIAVTDAFEYDADAVLAFLRSRGNHVNRIESMVGIGLRRAGRLIAGALFVDLNPHNVWVHVAARDAHAMTRGFVTRCLVYAFVTCGVTRVSAMIAASNWASLRIARKVGFKAEAVLAGAAQDGGDVLVMALRRQECRYHV